MSGGLPLPEEGRLRAQRKALVFHIMYGRATDATEDETREWRALCARYINGELVDPPLTLPAFRDHPTQKEKKK